MNDSGLLTSPLHPHAYPPMVDCIYLISRPNGSFINLTMFSMDIACQEIGSSDFIEIRDGNLEDSPLMGKFCGNGSTMPAFMQTTQNFMRIRFDTDHRSLCIITLQSIRYVTTIHK